MPLSTQTIVNIRVLAGKLLVKPVIKRTKDCFGLKCANYKFDLLSELVVDMANAVGILRIVNYSDDFAIVESSLEDCKMAQSTLIGILR